MDMGNLKKTIESIEMTEEMKARIIKNSRSKGKEITMEKTSKFNIKKYACAAAAAVLCLSITAVAAAAATGGGYFQDITGWFGAVTGTAYVQDTDEITVEAVAARDTLLVTATLLNPGAPPYSAAETMGVGAYQIVDTSGNVVAQGEGSDMAPVADGRAVMGIPLDGVEPGSYKLVISSFVSEKKADQPLRISGTWECPFTV